MPMNYTTAIWSGMISPRQYIGKIPKELIYKAVMEQDDLIMMAEICDLFPHTEPEGEILRDKISNNIPCLEILARLCPDEQLITSARVYKLIKPNETYKVFQWVNQFPNEYSIDLLLKVIPPNGVPIQNLLEQIYNPKAIPYVIRVLHEWGTRYNQIKQHMNQKQIAEFIKQTKEIGNLNNCIEIAIQFPELVEELFYSVLSRLGESATKQFAHLAHAENLWEKYNDSKFVIEN